MKKTLRFTSILGLVTIGVFFSSQIALANTYPMSGNVCYNATSFSLCSITPNNIQFTSGGNDDSYIYSGTYPDTSNLINYQHAGAPFGNFTDWLNTFATSRFFSTSTLTSNFWISFNQLGGDTYYQNFSYSNGTIRSNNTTLFISPYSPSNGTTTGSTLVSFSASYFFDDTSSYGILDTVAFDIVDLSAGTPPYRFGQHTINTSGYSSFSASQTLIAGDQYMWHPVMYSSTGSSSQTLSGDYYALQVLYNSASSTPFIGATVGTSTLPNATNLLSFLNVPNLLVTKVPFAYIFQISSGVQAGLSSSSTTAIPSGQFIWSGIHGTSTIDMFSTSTIGYYLSPTLISLWRSFLLIVLTVEFGYGLYHTARHQLHI